MFSKGTDKKYVGNPEWLKRSSRNIIPISFQKSQKGDVYARAVGRLNIALDCISFLVRHFDAYFFFIEFSILTLAFK